MHLPFHPALLRAPEWKAAASGSWAGRLEPIYSQRLLWSSHGLAEMSLLLARVSLLIPCPNQQHALFPLLSSMDLLNKTFSLLLLNIYSHPVVCFPFSSLFCVLSSPSLSIFPSRLYFLHLWQLLLPPPGSLHPTSTVKQCETVPAVCIPITFSSIFQTFSLHYQHHLEFKPSPPVHPQFLTIAQHTTWFARIISTLTPRIWAEMLSSTICQTSSCKTSCLGSLNHFLDGREWLLLFLSAWLAEGLGRVPIHLTSAIFRVVTQLLGLLQEQPDPLTWCKPIRGGFSKWEKLSAERSDSLLMCPKLVVVWRKRRMLYWSSEQPGMQRPHGSSEQLILLFNHL